jgi:hypothetical protein
VSDIRHLSHRTDPETSSTAALQLDAQGRASLKEALIDLLAEKPRTDDELAAVYRHRAEVNGWPLILDLHSVARRRSELVHKHDVVRDSGDRRLSNMGRKAVVWELTETPDDAKAIIRMKDAA